MAVLLLLLLLAGKGILALWKHFSGDVKDAFSGAREIERMEYDPDKLLVAVDAGHGGKDQGTCSGDILEKDINLAVALKLADELKKAGVQVFLTRTEDVKVDLEERARLANEVEADIFVSIHCNFYEDSAQISGLECYYTEESQEGQELAERISAVFDGTEQVENRGTKTANYRVLRKTDMQAVLIELGYMSNPEECRKLTREDYQELLAEKIAAGILEGQPNE